MEQELDQRLSQLQSQSPANDSTDASVEDVETAREPAAELSMEPTLAVDVIEQLRAEARMESSARSEPQPEPEQQEVPVVEMPPAEPSVVPTNQGEPVVADVAPTSEDELSFSAPTETAPVDTASILAKFGHMAEEEKEEESEPSYVAAPADELDRVSVAADEDEELDGFGEENSINDYMKQLMQRVGGHAVPSPPEEPSPEETAPVEVAADSDKPKTVTTSQTTPLDPSEFLPRAVAPEATSNLKTLREVANTSARSAIDKHQRKRYEQFSMIFWFAAIFSLMVGGTMIVWAKSVFSMPSYAAVGGLLLAVYCVSRALMYTAKAKFGSDATHKTLAENGFDINLDEEPAAPPVGVDPTIGAFPVGQDTPTGSEPADASQAPLDLLAQAAEAAERSGQTAVLDATAEQLLNRMKG